MRLALTILTILLVLALAVVVIGLWGTPLVERPWETVRMIIVGEELTQEKVSVEKKLTEVVDALDTLEKTATAVAVERGLTEAMATLDTLEKTATAIAAVPSSPPASAKTATPPDTAAPATGPTSTLRATQTAAPIATGTPAPTHSLTPRDAAPTDTPSASPAATSTPTSGVGPAATPKTAALTVVPTAAKASSEPACSQDSEGNAVCYPASNVIDGETATAWREEMSDGLWIEVELPQPLLVTQIAIVGGYDKIDPYNGSDRWRQNHRPRHVRVYLDPTPEGVHELADTREWQEIEIEPQRAQWVRLEIVDTYPPLEGSRTYVAISEIRVIGYQQ